MPDPSEIRKRIERVEDIEYKYCLMTTFILDARISEIVGEMCPGDTSSLYGIKGSYVKIENYEGEEVAVFKVVTAKRKPLGAFIRLDALPLKHEPWAEKIYDYFQSCGDNYVFNFNRQQAWVASKEAFEGLSYPIDHYSIYESADEEPDEIELEKARKKLAYVLTGNKDVDDVLVRTVAKMGIKKTIEVNPHLKPFRLHALRHERASELVDRFEFDGMDLATYGGWTIQTATQSTPQTRMSSSMSRYLFNSNWRSYVKKLIR